LSRRPGSLCGQAPSAVGRVAFAAAVLGALATFLVASSASASRSLKVGILDEAQTLYGNRARTFPVLRELRTQVLRVNLYWGGRFGVATSRPSDGADPADPAYNWTSYDRTVQYASRYGMKVLFSIHGTPAWANGGKAVNRAPTNPVHLQKFAFAAATRYSGTFENEAGRALPAVRMWAAWNEPNNQKDLQPQYRRLGGRWLIQSAIDYAKICNAIYAGVHSTLLSGEKVACGVTAPRGNNDPTSRYPKVSPLAFLRAMKSAGAKRFDAYAHHPYYGRPSESPTTKPSRTAITLANIDVLVNEVTRLYGRKPIWLTEYGYQTRPPDLSFGVSWALQARYLTQSFAMARKHPRIDVMIWFLLRDDTDLRNGWQSGFITATGKRKPSFNAFKRLPR